MQHVKTRDSRRLTDAVVRALPLAEPGERRRIAMEGCAGLRLEVGSKSKRWVAQHDLPKSTAPWGQKRGRTVIAVLGRWPDVSAKKAKTLAAKFVGDVRAGIDPREPFRRVTGPTLGSALDDHIATLTRTGASQNTIKLYKYLIGKLAKDWLDRPLADLATDKGRADVRARFTEFTRLRGPVLANQFTRVLSSVYSSCRNSNLRLPPDGPCVGLEMNPEGSRKHTGLVLTDLPRWYAALNELKNPMEKSFGLLGLLCGARPWVELSMLKRSDVRMRTGTLRFSRPKGWRPGKDNSFELPMTRPMRRAIAYARLLARKSHPNSEWLFPDDTKTGKLMKSARPVPAWGHALRHTFATIAEEVGFAEADYGPLMNHSTGSTTSKYPNRARVLRSRGLEVLTKINDAMIEAMGDAKWLRN